MPSYLILANLTDQGIRNIKEGPQRLDAFKQAVQAAEGRVIFFYMTMGEYDYAAVVEVPDDETAGRILLQLGSLGNVRSTSLKAFTEEEYRRMIAALP